MNNGDHEIREKHENKVSPLNTQKSTEVLEAGKRGSGEEEKKKEIILRRYGCNYFEIGQPNGDCRGDGHYMCYHCVNFDLVSPPPDCNGFERGESSGSCPGGENHMCCQCIYRRRVVSDRTDGTYGTDRTNEKKGPQKTRKDTEVLEAGKRGSGEEEKKKWEIEFKNPALEWEARDRGSGEAISMEQRVWSKEKRKYRRARIIGGGL